MFQNSLEKNKVYKLQCLTVMIEISIDINSCTRSSCAALTGLK